MEWLTENVSPKMQEEFWKYSMKNQMDIDKSVAKEYYLNDARMNLAQRRMCLQECRREAKSAEYFEVLFDSEGALMGRKRNALTQFPKRRIANFCVLEISHLQSSDGENGVFQLNLKIGNRPVQIYLNAIKTGQMDYILKKITAVGGHIYAGAKKEKEKILVALWVEMCNRCKNVYTIPVRRGWFKNERGEYKFAGEDTVLWAEIRAMAK